MEDVKLNEVFCEILSGLALLAFLLPLSFLTGLIQPSSLTTIIHAPTLAHLAAVVTLAYLLGLLVDALGLACGEWFIDGLITATPAPSTEERARFFREAQAHVFSYRDTQWAYYSCYRNVLFLLLPNAVAWTIVLMRYSPCAVLVMWFMTVVLGFSLYFTMRTLLELYYELTKLPRV